MTPALRQTLREVIALGEEAIGPVLMRRLEDEMGVVDCVSMPRPIYDRLMSAARLLLANSEGCATNHYGHDCSEQGMPGWLADARTDIENAVALSTSPAAPVAGDAQDKALRQIRAWFADGRDLVLNICEGNRNDLGDEQASELEDYEKQIALIDAALTRDPLPAEGVRDAALEEAAKIADKWTNAKTMFAVAREVAREAKAIAKAIRALQSPAPPVSAVTDACPACKGTGDVGDDSPRGCPECDGTGVRNHAINPTPADEAVSDAMVEAACIEFANAGDSTDQFPEWPDDQKVFIRNTMRSALAAAIKARGA